MNLLIRPATKEDAVLIADLSRQTFYETFAEHNTPADMQKFMNEQFTRGKLMLEVGRPELQFYLAYIEGNAAGYVKLRDAVAPTVIGEENALEIARLYAASQYVGKGVGKALMEKSLQVAADLKKKAVWLGVWESNQRAIDFYHKWGFQKCGTQDFHLGNDVQRDWLMKKVL